MLFKVLLVLASAALLCSGQLSSGDASVATQKLMRLPGIDTCGLTKSTSGRRIIGGRPVRLGDYPWMANIGYRKRGTSDPVRWRCGGSLVTNQHVITAAHCLYPPLLREKIPWNNFLFVSYDVVTVRLGELNLDPKVNDSVEPQDFEVEKITYHEQYNDTTKINDIGLIKLKTKVQFSEFIRPICLPLPEFNANLFVGYSPVVAGWGKAVNETYVTTPNYELLEAEVQIKDMEDCRRNITSLKNRENLIIDDTVICAASPGKDSCQGDSGGPLMFYRKIRDTDVTGNMFLMGIVSYGYLCAVPGYPAVYTRAAKFMPWIIDNLDI